MTAADEKRLTNNEEKPMKMIHCGDIHLESPLSTNFDHATALKRRNELLVSFIKMVKYAADNRMSAILIAGDIFDTPDVSRETLAIVMACIMKNPEITFIYLPGNHEKDVLLRAFSEMPANLKVFSAEQKMFIVENVVVAHADRPEELPTLYPGDMNIVMYHGEMDDARIRAWAGRNINYMALGHYHSYSEGVIDPRGVYCYSGCLEGRGFDECGPKGFVVLDYENNTLNRYFVPSAVRTIHEIVIDVTGLGGIEKIDEEIEKRVDELPREDMLKIVLKGSYLAGDSINTAFLQQRYNSMFFAVRVDASGIRLDMPEKDYRFDKSLKGEFIRQVMVSHDLSESQKQMVVDMGLRALAGERL